MEGEFDKGQVEQNDNVCDEASSPDATLPQAVLAPFAPAEISGLPLGRQVDYTSTYSPSLLCPIARQLSRNTLDLDSLSELDGSPLPFRGEDIWTAYEISWLEPSGKPCVAIGEFRFSANSPNMIESKSFKLYLNSLNQTRFQHLRKLVTTLEEDLSAVTGGDVYVKVIPLAALASVSGVQPPRQRLGQFPGDCLDWLPVEPVDYHPNADLLTLAETDKTVTEVLYSDLLKTNCPVTGQPDWASVLIKYTGPSISHHGLLNYIISFREHQDFHEHCIERIFTDILRQCSPRTLTVYGRYTRRGGLDINVFRTNTTDTPLELRLVRQ